jgi:hypothetical protein
LEGIGEADAFERQVFVLTPIRAQAVEGFFDVDGGDVVGQQDDLVGVEFVLVFPQQVRPARSDRTGATGR